MRSMAALRNALLAAGGGFLVKVAAEVVEVGVLTEEAFELLLAYCGLTWFRPPELFVLFEDFEDVNTKYIRALAVGRVMLSPKACSDGPFPSASRSNRAPITPK